MVYSAKSMNIAPDIESIQKITSVTFYTKTDCGKSWRQFQWVSQDRFCWINNRNYPKWAAPCIKVPFSMLEMCRFRSWCEWAKYCLGLCSLLTLKAPRKTVSENVVCLCRLLNILANFSKLFFAYQQTVWTQIRLLLKEQSDMGPYCLQKWLLKSQAEDKADDNCCDWRFKG